jgi:DNA-binding transcriptional ArsR family regulator
LDRVSIVRTPKEIVLSRTSRKNRTNRTSAGKKHQKGRKHRRVNLTPRPVTPLAQRADRADAGPVAAPAAVEAAPPAAGTAPSAVDAAPTAAGAAPDATEAAPSSAGSGAGEASAEGLSRNAQRTLARLYESGPQGATPADLGEAVGYTVRTVTRHLAGLARNGLVVRQADGRWSATVRHPDGAGQGLRLPGQSVQDPARDGLGSRA